MIRIIPAILTKDAKEFKDRVTLVAPFVNLVQVDIMNGTFVPEVSFGSPEEILAMHLPVAFEMHLMINEPEQVVHEWARVGASRIIIHAESTQKLGLAIEKIKQYSKKVGLAFNPETDPKDFRDLLDIIDFVQLMGVTPGAMGREFNEIVFDKIAYLKKEKPRLGMAVDGGVGEKNILQLARAGVTDFGVGSAIFHQKDPVAALKSLQALVRYCEEV